MKLSKAFQPLISLLKNTKELKQSQSSDVIETSLWQDTGQVYYLVNTLKLSYESEYGPVTFENLNLHSLRSLLDELKHTQTPHLKQKVTAGQTYAYNISLCGVTWQQNENSTRIKAITESAVLRSLSSDFKRSQAVFKHEVFLEHHDILNAPSTNNQNGVFTYSNVSIEQFIRHLEQANAEISSDLKRRISVNPENFKALYSNHEQAEIDALLKLDSETSVLTDNSNKD
jgi:hypothetical protein